MNLSPSPICEDQHHALSNYLEALLFAPEMSSSSQATLAPLIIPAPEAVSGASLKCFIFTVAGLKLALPLARVTEIVDFSACGGTPRPPQVLGSLAYEGHQVPVLDSAHIILPGSHPAPAYRWLVVVDQGSYALACDAVAANIEVAQEAVRWRTTSTKRRWLAGTLLQHRCALLDADEVYQQCADNMV